jgi:hypothetical protein
METKSILGKASASLYVNGRWCHGRQRETEETNLWLGAKDLCIGPNSFPPCCVTLSKFSSSCAQFHQLWKEEIKRIQLKD